MRRFIAAAAFAATIFLSASASLVMAESRFGWGGSEKPLEAKCLSDSQVDRDQCFGYIQALLDHYQPVTPRYTADSEAAAIGAAHARRDVQEGSIGKREIGCFLGDFYTLRNVAVTGYREILEHRAWLDSIDGKVTIAGAGTSGSLIAPREFVEKIEPARDSIRELRRTGKVSWLCRLSR